MYAPPLAERIRTFTALGGIISAASGNGSRSTESELLRGAIAGLESENSWFTPEWTQLSLSSIAGWLTEESLYGWLAPYGIDHDREAKNIGVIMAGNIPLVGFHDALSVLITGNRLIAHRSSKDSRLISAIAGIIASIDPGLGGMISFGEEDLHLSDAVIATGSDNSSRYFNHLYGEKPHIFRKNRSSAAVVPGDCSTGELELLAHDIFSYFGLGCRNVSRLWLPRGFDLHTLSSAWSSFSRLNDHTGWNHNLRYQRALAAVEGREVFDGGFFILEEMERLSSPLGVIYYSRYNDEAEAGAAVESYRESLQTVAGPGYNRFGTLQHPGLADYADGVDTISFLLDL